MAREQGFACVNGDCTVIADTPRLAPHTEAMTGRLSAVLGAPVSVKATRAEGLGALGRAEGIACLAIVLLEKA
jgi:2-C-methyl-D-erythritol 2,4-cyclodiphosphate synthase